MSSPQRRTRLHTRLLWITALSAAGLHAGQYSLAQNQAEHCETDPLIRLFSTDPAGALGDVRSAAARVPNLTQRTLLEAEQRLTELEFRFKNTTAGGYRQWKHADGSVIWIRPNGEVVRTGPKIRSSSGKMYAPRIDQYGRRASEHNTGEFLVPTW